MSGENLKKVFVQGISVVSLTCTSSCIIPEPPTTQQIHSAYASEVKTTGTVNQVIAKNNTQFQNALYKANLNQMLSDKKKTFTVFAPSDKAFNSLKKGTIDKLQKDGNLEKVLSYHIIPNQKIEYTNLKQGPIKTVQGNKVKIKIRKSGKEVGDENAKIKIRNLKASNGVIHVIDDVLFPSEVRKP